MLVLTRKENESLHIGDDVVITVTRARGGNVRLAIEAPAHVTVHRTEVYRKVLAAREAQQPLTLSPA